MALGNLFGRKKSNHAHIQTDKVQSYHYLHRQGRSKVSVSYAPDLEVKSMRVPGRICQRVLLYARPTELNFDETLEISTRKKMAKAEQELIKQLGKAGVDCQWVGNLTYQGVFEVVFMTADAKGFQEAFHTWLKKAQAYRVEALACEGWDYFDAHIVPNKLTRQEMRDVEVIDQLTKGGTNLEVGHWTNHTIKGPDDLLLQLVEEMKNQDFYQLEQGQEKLVLEKCMKLNLLQFSEALLSLRARCQQLALEYVGWDTPIVKDTVLSGSIQDGFGSYVWANGLRYDGEWANGKRTGKGHMRFHSGTQYIGDFIGDDRTGQAKMIYNHNESYQGAFLKGELHGEGSYWWPSGNAYHGDWYYGNKHGKGTFWWHTKDIYQGDYVQDERTGFGVYFWHEGDWFEGDFVKGKCHGKGKEYFHDKLEMREGQYAEGTWKSGTTLSNGVNLRRQEPPRPEDGTPVSPPPAKAGPGTAPETPAPPPPIPAPTPVATPAPAPSTSTYSGSIDLSKRKPVKLDISWTLLDVSNEDLLDAIGKEARFASAKAMKCFLFLNGGSSGPSFNLKERIIKLKVADLFAQFHLIEVGGAQYDALTAGGFPASQAPTLFKLYPNGRFGEAYWDAVDQVDTTFEFSVKIKELVTA